MKNSARAQILGNIGAASDEHFHELKSQSLSFVEQAASLSALLIQKLEAVHGSVELVDSIDEITASLKRFVQSFDGELRIHRGSSSIIDQLPLDHDLRFSDFDDYSACETYISQATCAIAETGSLVMASNSQCPSEANFLPDNCVIVLKESDILPYMEDAFRFVLQKEGNMPRALNLISGPSKTADIEQTLVYGAHGPIRLHVILLRL